MGLIQPAPVTTSTYQQLVVTTPVEGDHGKVATFNAEDGRVRWMPGGGGGGGGVIGHAETWLTPNTYAGPAGGEGGLDEGAVEWDAPYNPGGGANLPANEFSLSSGRIYFDQNGYYLVTVWIDAMWAEATGPSWARTAFNCGPTLGGNSETYTAIVPANGYRNLSHVVSLGVIHSDGGFAYLNPLVRWEGGKAAPLSFSIGVHIAKLSQA